MDNIQFILFWDIIPEIHLSLFQDGKAIVPRLRVSLGINADQLYFRPNQTMASDFIKLQVNNFSSSIKFFCEDQLNDKYSLIGQGMISIEHLASSGQLSLSLNKKGIETVRLKLKYKRQYQAIPKRFCTQINTLDIRVQLFNIKKLGKIEPYIEFRAGYQKKRTIYLQENRLEWRQSFSFNIENKNFLIFLKQKNDRPSEYIGKAKFYFLQFKLPGLKIFDLRDDQDSLIGQISFRICRADDLQVNRIIKQRSQFAKSKRLKTKLQEKNKLLASCKILPKSITLYNFSVRMIQQIYSDLLIQIKTINQQATSVFTEIEGKQASWKWFRKFDTQGSMRVTINIYSQKLGERQQLATAVLTQSHMSGQQVELNCYSQGFFSGIFRLDVNKDHFDLQKYISQIKHEQEIDNFPDRFYLSNFTLCLKQNIQFPDYKILKILYANTVFKTQAVNNSQLRVDWLQIFQINRIPESNKVNFQLQGNYGLIICSGQLELKKFKKKKRLKLCRTNNQIIAQLYFSFSDQRPEMPLIQKKKNRKRLDIKNINFELNFATSLTNIYLVARFSDICLKSQHIKASMTFNKKLSFKIHNQKSIEFQLKSTNGFSSISSIGRSVIKLNQLSQGQTQRKKLKLIDEKGSQVGKLAFQFTITSLKDEIKLQDFLASKEQIQIKADNRYKIQMKSIHRKKSLQTKPFGDSLFLQKSASTLQNSIHSFSFSKDKRFVATKPQNQFVIMSKGSKLRLRKIVKTLKGSGFGIGDRPSFPGIKPQMSYVQFYKR